MTANTARAREREQLRKNRRRAKAAKRQAPDREAWQAAWQAGKRGERP